MLKKILVALLLSSLITFHSSLLLASEINLPRTGQTLCYNAGTVISCSGTGQDGAILAGQPFPSPRYTAANGAVTDNLTGLIWLQNANCRDTLGGVVKTSTLTWANALTWSNALASGYCGLTDGSIAGQWRLPSILELESLVDPSNLPPLSTGHPFAGIVLDYYWSSSSKTNNTGTYNEAWVVDMRQSAVSGPSKTVTSYVWPVRSGQ